MAENTKEFYQRELARWKGYSGEAFEEVQELKAFIDKSILFEIEPDVYLEHIGGKWYINSQDGEGNLQALTDQGGWVYSVTGKAFAFESWRVAMVAFKKAQEAA